LAFWRVFEAQLGETSADDLPAYLAAGVLVITTFLVAILIAGMRALQIGPARTLRR
jgi:hypothetical protein